MTPSRSPIMWAILVAIGGAILLRLNWSDQIFRASAIGGIASGAVIASIGFLLVYHLERSLARGTLLLTLNLTRDLTNVDLSNMDLRKIKLRGKTLLGANLSGSNLDSVDLRGTDLRGAYLIKASLRDADLRACKLDGAVCTGADFSGSMMWDVSARASIFDEANFTDANLAGLHANPIEEQHVRDIYDLGGTVWSVYSAESAVSNARYRVSDFEDAKFIGAILTGADLRGSNLRRADFGFAQLSPPGEQVSLERAAFKLRYLRRYGLSRLTNHTYRGTYIGSGPANLLAADLSDTKFYATDLNKVDLPGNVLREHCRGVVCIVDDWASVPAHRLSLEIIDLLT